MIVGSIIVAVTLFVFLFDFAYLHKKHRLTILTEGLLFLIVIVANAEHFFAERDFYSGNGMRMDLILVLVLIREAILGRVARIDNRKDITRLVQSAAVDNLKQIK